ncbi:DegT/DnrJ/EryC1/StrS family aminotransferase [Fibrobacterota bacterium]
MKIPFFQPCIDGETELSVLEVLRSGWLTTGSKTLEFEKKFAEYVGTDNAVMVNSGTAALHLCMAALDLQPGDEVITTPYTFAATAEVVEYFNAKPVFVDVRKDTLNINEKSIEERINSRTRAIIPVHFAGHPCEMNTIMEIADRHNLLIVEDAAHCTPAYYQGRPVGSLGHCTCFSFYANKCITTGEGGMVTTADSSLADKIRSLRLHGLSKDAVNRYQKSGSWEYDIIARGYKYNPTDISAAIGLGQLKQADSFHRERKKIAAWYTERLQDIPEIHIPKEAGGVDSSWHLFPIRLCGQLQGRRNGVIDELRKREISVSVHFKPLHLHSYYADKYAYRPEDFPVANEAYQGLITLPVYPGLNDKQVDFIVKNLIEILHE